MQIIGNRVELLLDQPTSRYETSIEQCCFESASTNSNGVNTTLGQKPFRTVAVMDKTGVRSSTENTTTFAAGVNYTDQSSTKMCTPQCKCLCHSRHRHISPRFLQRIFGNIQVEYVAIPFTENFCHVPSCAQQSSPLAQIRYFFPSWLLLRMVCATIAARSPNMYEVTIRAPRVVPDSSEIFCCAASGNVQEMKMLFQNGVASVYDIDVTSGVSALAVGACFL